MNFRQRIRISFIAILLLVCACVPQKATSTQSPAIDSQISPISSTPSPTSAQELEAVPANPAKHILPTEIPPEENSLGPENISDLVNMPKFQEQAKRLTDWIVYWSQCDEAVLNPQEKINWKLIYDDPAKPTEAFLILEMDNAYYAEPVDQGVWQDPPSEKCSGALDPGYAPTLLAEGDQRQFLRIQGGKLAMVDEEGQFVNYLELKGSRLEADAVTDEMVQIDLDRLNNFPESYAYLSANPGEFQRAPDPLYDVDAFEKWWNEALLPVLGEMKDREINYTTVTYVNDRDWDHLNFNTGYAAANSIKHPKFFFFTHRGVTYPVLLISVGYPGDEAPFLTVGVILYDGFGAPEGTGVIASIAAGVPVRHVSLYRRGDTPVEPIVRSIVNAGINDYPARVGTWYITIGRVLTAGK